MRKVLGVIPARFGSTRLPGKPLKLIGTKTMIQHTYESSGKSKLLDELVVLTDDERIFRQVESFGGKVSLTPSELNSGTDRAAYFIESNREYDIIVNIQGDEPFINPEIIDKSIEPLLESNEYDVATAATRFKNSEDVTNPNYVKALFNPEGTAIYFSRSPIPFYRDEKAEKVYYKHIGIYTYKRDALLKISKLPQSRLEIAEKLEQLRIIENGFKIKVVEVDYEPISIDTEEDLIRANEIYNSKLN